MSQDITFCGYNKCPYTSCERHQSNITDFRVMHSFAYFHDCDKYPPRAFSEEQQKLKEKIQNEYAET